MVLFNYSTKELTAKVVYYGPGLCGKTTNLQYVHANLPGSVKGKMLSLATKTDRTLFFDFLPLDLGTIRGMKTRIQLYTVPGQVFYNETRKLVLKGADGIVFVADSQEQMLQANVESFRNLEENLKAHGMTLGEMPHVLQFNKRDLPRIASVEDMNAAINKFNAPFYETVATTGIGVQDTLKAITKLVLLHLTTKYDPKSNARRAADTAVTPPVVEPRPAASRQPTAATSAGIPLSDAEPLHPAVETPAAAPARMEVAAESVSADGPPPPPNFHGSESIDDTPLAPQFEDDEMDGFMDEVGDPGGVPAVAASAEFATGVPETPEPQAAEAMPDAPEPILHPFPIPDAEAPVTAETSDAIAEFGEATVEMPAAGIDWGASSDSDDEAGADVAPIELPDAQPAPFGGPAGEFDDGARDEHREEPHDVPAGVGAEFDHAPVPLAADGEPDRPAFELDSSFAPEWNHESDGDGLRTSTVDRAEPPPAVLFDPPAEYDREPGSFDDDDHAADDVPLELTEVADDDHSLFEDPTLDVARLAAGHAKEIVVPVELGEGTEMRRFKLSVTLKLDPVD